MRRLALILATLALVASAGLANAGFASAREPVLVFAAASTRVAMQEAISGFETSENSNEIKIKGVYAASSALARQILDGAPASIFLSANIAWANVLDMAGHLEDRRNFLSNRLVVAAPADTPFPVSISTAQDLVSALGEGRLAVGETRSVPVGQYARQALTGLGVWKILRHRVAQASNARTALLLVERGEAPLGIVYATDAGASSRVKRLWTIPRDVHAPIIYPLALVKSQSTNEPAKAFLAYLASPAGRAIFAAHGFETR